MSVVLTGALGRVTKLDAFPITNKQSEVAHRVTHIQTAINDWPVGIDGKSPLACAEGEARYVTSALQKPVSTSYYKLESHWVMMQKQNKTKHPLLDCKLKQSFEIRVLKEYTWNSMTARKRNQSY